MSISAEGAPGHASGLRSSSYVPVVSPVRTVRTPVPAALRETPHGALAADLAVARQAGRGVSVTWLNHFSAQVALDEGDALSTFDVVAVDGTLLQKMLGTTARTSADLVLPLLLPLCDGARVALIGGTPDNALERSVAIQALLPGSASVVATIDGFSGVADREAMVARLAELRVDVVIVGMGAGLQEELGALAAGALGSALVLTCGGFMDQVTHIQYYPSWAYPLHLNWLVRLAREPRRLWRRYTVDATRALARRRQLRSRISALPGYEASIGDWEPALPLPRAA